MEVYPSSGLRCCGATIDRYDNAGNLTWRRDPLGRWTETFYDALNRPYEKIRN